MDEKRYTCYHLDAPRRFKKRSIETFTKGEVIRMLKACLYSRECKTHDQCRYAKRWQTANRYQAIILIRVDSGLHALELCPLKIEMLIHAPVACRRSTGSKVVPRVEKAEPFYWVSRQLSPMALSGRM